MRISSILYQNVMKKSKRYFVNLPNTIYTSIMNSIDVVILVYVKKDLLWQNWQKSDQPQCNKTFYFICRRHMMIICQTTSRRIKLSRRRSLEPKNIILVLEVEGWKCIISTWRSKKAKEKMFLSYKVEPKRTNQ